MVAELDRAVALRACGGDLEPNTVVGRPRVAKRLEIEAVSAEADVRTAAGLDARKSVGHSCNRRVESLDCIIDTLVDGRRREDGRINGHPCDVVTRLRIHYRHGSNLEARVLENAAAYRNVGLPFCNAT